MTRVGGSCLLTLATTEAAQGNAAQSKRKHRSEIRALAVSLLIVGFLLPVFSTNTQFLFLGGLLIVIWGNSSS